MTEITFTAVCRPFRGFARAPHRILFDVGADERDPDARVWDSVAGHFTRCHALSRRSQIRLLRAALKAGGAR